MKYVIIFWWLTIVIGLDIDIDWNQVYHVKQIHLAPQLEPRIINGQIAKPHQFPYQVGIYSTRPLGVGFCGGSLISQKYILTAAICIDDATEFKIILGSNNVIKPDNTSLIINSKTKIVHYEWDRRFLLNDIALIELPKQISLNEYIKTIKLPSRSQQNELFVNEIATISGWGVEHDTPVVISQDLRYARNPVLSNDCCRASMMGIDIPPSQICQSGAGIKGACNGDNGGPLVLYNENMKPLQIGIASYYLTAGCERGFPVAYTRVTYYLDWIEQNSDIVIDP